jgi:DNA-binding LacI/PurR family transcriptional regulator
MCADWRLADSPFTAVSRLAGWAAGLAEVGVEPVVVNADDSTEASGRQAAQALLGMSPAHRPTAVLAYSDRIAQGVIEAAHDAGLDVPGDISVVGFDDADFSSRTRPSLTTVRQDVARKGHEATALLLDAIARRSAQRTDHRVLPTDLVVRGSTAAPPSAHR